MKTGPEKTENYIEAGLIVDAQIHEAVCNFIVERFAGGLILDDKEGGDQVGITFYIADGEHAGFEKLLADYIRDRCGDENFSEADIKTKKIANLEWIQLYRDSIKPVEIGSLYIHPPWIEASKNHAIDLVIEPRMAFGTGNHESTRLCLQAILEYLHPGDSFFDLGCGSGILSIVAAKLGAGFVRGVDIDPIAVQNAVENAELNGVSGKLEIIEGSVDMAQTEKPFDLIAANIIRSTIMELFDGIYQAVKPGGIIVLSGLLVEDKDAVLELFNSHDITKYYIKQDGEWIGITAFKR